VNDSVGMAVGDSILLTLARPPRPAVEAAGHALRGSAAISFGPADPVRARTAAHHRLRRHHPQERCARPITFNDREILLTASIGLALAGRHAAAQGKTC